MIRREFIAGLGSAAAWPVLALAARHALPAIFPYREFSVAQQKTHLQCC
jgi:hypothetical protein